MRRDVLGPGSLWLIPWELRSDSWDRFALHPSTHAQTRPGHGTSRVTGGRNETGRMASKSDLEAELTMFGALAVAVLMLTYARGASLVPRCIWRRQRFLHIQGRDWMLTAYARKCSTRPGACPERQALGRHGHVRWVARMASPGCDSMVPIAAVSRRRRQRFPALRRRLHELTAFLTSARAEQLPLVLFSGETSRSICGLPRTWQRRLKFSSRVHPLPH